MANAAYQAGDEVRSGVLYRRIYPSDGFFRDGRPTSANFDPDKSDGAVSMSLASEATQEETLDGHQGFGLLEIDAEWLWEHGHGVIYEPILKPKVIRGHVAVRGFTKNGVQARRAAALESRLLIDPTIRQRG